VRLGLTQERLAERECLCRTFVGKLERGQTGINLVELPALARAPGCGRRSCYPSGLARSGGRHER